VVARRRVGRLQVGRAGGGEATADLRHVAVIGGWAAHRPGGERIGRAGVARPVAALGEVARAGHGPTDAGGRLVAGTRRARCAAGVARWLESIGRARRARAIARLGDVASAGRGAAEDAGVAGRMLTEIARPVALIERAGVPVVGAGRPV